MTMANQVANLVIDDLMAEVVDRTRELDSERASNKVLREMVNVLTQQLNAGINIQKRLEASLYGAVGRNMILNQQLAEFRTVTVPASHPSRTTATARPKAVATPQAEELVCPSCRATNRLGIAYVTTEQDGSHECTICSWSSSKKGAVCSQ
jgi:hypothetical protein